jgi:fatty-acid desaturase
MRRFEVDPSWLVIRVMAALGLAVVVGAPVSVLADGEARG